jgi:urease accessory protein
LTGYGIPSSWNSDFQEERNSGRVGRDGFLRLRFARSGACTILAQSRFSLPLQILTPLTLAGGASYLMLLNPTGGVLGGDHLTTEIVQETGTHVCLTTPSATRIYRTLDEPAILETVIRVGENAILEYFPDHIIPHTNSAVRQSLRVEMTAGSRAILFDSMASGRVAHGERWKFREMDSRTDVFSCNRPVYINRTKILPTLHPPDRLGWMEDFDYLGTVGFFADGFSNWKEFCSHLNDLLSAIPKIRGAASMLARNGCAVRFLAHSASDMTSTNQKLWDLGRRALLNLAPFEHRKY